MSWTGHRTDNRLRRLITYPVRLGFVLTLLVGCKSTSNRSDLVEAELRSRDAEVRELRVALQRSEMLNAALTSHPVGIPITGINGFTPPSGSVTENAKPSTAVMSGTIKEVVLGRGTGGIDQDGIPGDEALMVVVTPKDTDGSALKVPGNLIVQTFEFTAEGQKVPHNQWEVPPLDLQKSWKNGLLATGYHLTLPWKSLPNSPKLRVVVQFTTLGDRRTFEAERDITIRLMPAIPRGPASVPPTNSFPAPVVPMTRPGGVTDPPVDGPILTPSAWFRRRESAAWIAGVQPMSQPVVSAKPDEHAPATLLEPQLPD